MLKPGRSSGFNKDRRYLYIGSATQYNHGLSDAKDKLESTSRWNPERGPKHAIRHHQLNMKGTFITLSRVPFKGDCDAEIRRVRRVVVIARAVFRIWLGVVADDANEEFTESTPWNLKDIMYHGFTRCNCFSKNIVDPEESRKKREKREKRETEILLKSMRKTLPDISKRHMELVAEYPERDSSREDPKSLMSDTVVSLGPINHY